MAHNAQAVFFKTVKKTYPDFFEWKNVLEVGSLDINGSVRPLFQNCNYVGVDLDYGPGVDLAVQGQEVAFPDDSFDVTISAECFEHNPYWIETFENMVRMTKPGGLVTFTCAGEGRPEHGTARSDAGSSPLTTSAGWDYYRNLMEDDFYDHVSMKYFDETHQFFYNPHAQDLYFIGMKNGASYGGDWKGLKEVDWNGINADNY